MFTPHRNPWDWWLLFAIAPLILTSQSLRAETSVSITDISKSEYVEGEEITFRVTATDTSLNDFSVNVNIEIKARGGYVAKNSETRTVNFFTSGRRQSATESQMVRIRTTNDALDRPDGSVTVRLQSGSGFSLNARNQIAHASVRLDQARRTFTIRDDDELPGSPTDFTAESGAGTMALNWTPPTDTGKLNGRTVTITRHEVRWARASNNIANVPWRQWQGSTENYSIEDLTAHQRFNFQVRAVTQTGAGPIASASAVQLNNAPTVRLNPIAATIHSSERLNLSALATDSDSGDTLRYTWTTDPPNLGSFSNSGATPTWTAPWVRIPSEVTLQVQVSDGSQQDSTSRKITVQPAKMELTASSQSVSEGGSGVHQISLSVSNSTGSAFPSPISALINVNAPNVELVNPPTSVTIPAGQSSASFSVGYRGNLMNNPDRQVTVTLQPNDWYTPSPDKSTAIVTIQDDDDLPT